MTWKAGAFAAIAAIVGFASPAAAAVPSTTAVQASPSTAVTGAPVQLTATVTCTGDPSGGLGMTFFDGADTLATVPVGANGQANFTATFATTGTHTITAAYNGNDNCFASNATATVAVTAAEDCPWGPLPCRDGHAHPPGTHHPCPTRPSTPSFPSFPIFWGGLSDANSSHWCQL
ncbi:Ig-like domain-containing protein [Streptomyces sp. NPDC088354]|uniref:Ig-like domain-containing protein n=1 Tax=Streptomyces sp. NPDC088354 TaxID=3365856 RepID=UPI003823804B